MIVFKSALLLILLIYWRPEETMKPYVVSYIEVYKYVAIDEMVRSGIPASVTMAQAIVESNAGASYLARESNNHFGIKCKSYWTGDSFYHPDDDRDENGKLVPSCFRSYESVVASYADHSDFLMNTAHYQSLFSYDRTDYVNWSEGLQLNGYATDRAYAEKLIKIIKLYNLQELDYYTIQYVERSSLTDSAETSASKQ